MVQVETIDSRLIFPLLRSFVSRTSMQCNACHLAWSGGSKLIPRSNDIFRIQNVNGGPLRPLHVGHSAKRPAALTENASGDCNSSQPEAFMNHLLESVAVFNEHRPVSVAKCSEKIYLLCIQYLSRAVKMGPPQKERTLNVRSFERSNMEQPTSTNQIDCVGGFLC